MGKQKKPPTPKKNCIFCGKTGVTKEHLWPDWLKNYIPIDSSSHTHTTQMSRLNYNTGMVRESPIIKIQSGNLMAQKLRIVCDICNNEWMSRLQESAKPLLIPFIKGEWLDLNLHERGIVSAWLTMYTMVYEFKHPPTIVASFEDRNLFRERVLPPYNWFFWIGLNDGLWDKAHHKGLGLVDQLSKEIPEKCNIQSTTIALNKLILHVVGGPRVVLIGSELERYNNSIKLQRFWPPINTGFWGTRIKTLDKPNHIFTPGDCAAVGHALESFFA
ncbi:hypothetical protein [Nevskia ramosa]|uniref:hypothetical protein n=1 Tax=Nevskia ramosa TaxID=64002 RepID=UPI003D12B50A